MVRNVNNAQAAKKGLELCPAEFEKWIYFHLLQTSVLSEGREMGCITFQFFSRSEIHGLTGSGRE